ncbi:UNVERIFIED_CONTAM: hypothetical protein Sradi_5712800 [Sesamum radiatum]|uniref:Uncharacterized protein n=1 Tax=Sesamum radiatum TaxID=300843 RepID=A0AAW2L4F1_SESRA
MEGETPRRDEGPSRQTDPILQTIRSELQRLMEEAGRNAIAQHERITATLVVREAPRRQLFGEREADRGQEGASREARSRRVGDRAIGKQISDLKRRGEIVVQNKNFLFSNRILTEVVDPSFRMPDLPKYGGTKDPQEHVAAFELDLRVDMIVSILIHGLKKGPLASALARDPPEDIEQLMKVAQKYIDEEEINAMKDGEWQRFTPAKKYSNKYCKFHKERGHDTEECYQLKDEIERLVRQGYFKEYKLEREEPRNCKVRNNGDRSRSRSRDIFRGRQTKDRRIVGERDNVPIKGVIHTIAVEPEEDLELEDEEVEDMERIVPGNEIEPAARSS